MGTGFNAGGEREINLTDQKKLMGEKTPGGQIGSGADLTNLTGANGPANKPDQLAVSSKDYVGDGKNVNHSSASNILGLGGKQKLSKENK